MKKIEDFDKSSKIASLVLLLNFQMHLLLQRWHARPGEKTPPPPGGEAPGRRGAKPPDSIEQEAKPPVQWKAVLKVGFNVS